MHANSDVIISGLRIKILSIFGPLYHYLMYIIYFYVQFYYGSYGMKILAEYKEQYECEDTASMKNDQFAAG